MEFYFAPMEGITGYIFRNAYERNFSNIDKYFTPFIAPNQNKCFNSRELHDILPENNPGITLVPQILTSSSKDFIRTAEELKKYGYDEINLNLGCPSKTVVSKGRGAGFLGRLEELSAFLEEIFEKADCPISIKTRIGVKSRDEMYSLMELFNRYPLKQLIIHPRLAVDFYNNHPDLDLFSEALAVSKNPVCYNGDIFTPEDYESFMARFPGVSQMMLGRGLLKNPGFIFLLKGLAPMDSEKLKSFHDQVYAGYREVLSGEKPVLYKMKELWFYLAPVFNQYEKYAKKIKKAERCKAYEETVENLFRQQKLAISQK